MVSHNKLLHEEQLHDKVLDCANWINNLKDQDYIICPIQQSSFYFISNLFPLLKATPPVDFCGVSFYSEDGTQDGLYIYKGPSVNTYNNKTVIVIDVICNTGTTMDSVARFLKQMGAKKVLTAAMLVRQWSKHKPNWRGYKLSDETVYGYGMDIGHRYRTLPYVAYE